MDAGYLDRLRPWIGGCFVLGPSLLLVSGILAATQGQDTTWQGVAGQYGGYSFVAIYLYLGAAIGASRARLGVFTTVLGLIGSAAMVQAFASYFAAGLLGTHVGFEPREALTTMSANPSTAQMVGGIVGLTVPLSMIWMGVALWLSEVGPRFSAVCLAMAGVVFVSSQAVANNTGEWLSPLLLLMAMLPLAVGVLRRQLTPLRMS